MTLLLFLLARSLVLHGTISGQSSAPIDCKPDRMADRHADVVVVVGMGKKDWIGHGETIVDKVVRARKPITGRRSGIDGLFPKFT